MCTRHTAMTVKVTISTNATAQPAGEIDTVFVKQKKKLKRKRWENVHTNYSVHGGLEEADFVELMVRL